MTETIDLQQTYYLHLGVKDNPHISNDSLSQLTKCIIDRRDCIKHYHELLTWFRPVLAESLVMIYYNPAISMLLEILATSPEPRHFQLILRHLYCKVIQSQFPHGDNHINLMTHFIATVANGKISVKEFK